MMQAVTSDSPVTKAPQPTPLGQQVAQGPLSNPNSSLLGQQLLNTYNANVIQPYDQNVNNQIANLGFQGAITDQSLGLQSQYLSTNLGQQLQGLGLSGQQLGVQQGALNRQGVLDPQLQNIQEQSYGLQNQSLQAQAANVQFTSDQQRRATQSDATAKGSINTTGFSQALSDIGTNLAYQLGSIGREEQQLGLTKQSEELQYGEKIASLGDAQKLLDISGKQLNLSRDELVSRVNNSLQQIGLNVSLNDVQVAQGIQDLQNGRYTNLANILTQVGSVDPSLLSGLKVNTQADTNYGGGEAGINSALQAANQQPISSDEAWLINAESGFNTDATNKSSGAFGLGQLNPASGTLQDYAKKFGYDPHTTDPVQQMTMMRAYIQDRYGSAANAVAFHKAHGWY